MSLQQYRSYFLVFVILIFSATLFQMLYVTLAGTRVVIQSRSKLECGEPHRLLNQTEWVDVDFILKTYKERIQSNFEEWNSTRSESGGYCPEHPPHLRKYEHYVDKISIISDF